MSIQFFSAPTALVNFVVFNPTTYLSHTKPILASCLDYGFDFDEEELGREMLTPLPASLANQLDDQIDADEFESRYRWFNS